MQKALRDAIAIKSQENLDRASRKDNGVLTITGHLEKFRLIRLEMHYAGYPLRHGLSEIP